MVDALNHYIEAERLLLLAKSREHVGTEVAREYMAAAQVHAVLASTEAPPENKPVRAVTWDAVLTASSLTWADGGAPNFPSLVEFAQALGLEVMERGDPDADAAAT